MTSRERVLIALRLQEPDRICLVGNIFMDDLVHATPDLVLRFS